MKFALPFVRVISDRGIIGKYPRCFYWIGHRWMLRGKTWAIYGVETKVGIKRMVHE